MKKILPIFILVILVFSCKKKPQLALPTISINSFPIEKASIRAILPKSKDTVFYAGSNGQIGYTFNSGKTWHSQSIRYQDSIYPEFRSIATNTKDIFVLSVGNPALLYKLSGQKVQRVYKEEDQRVFYDAMCFFDTDKGMAMGDPTAADCLSVITTKDGGLSWQKKSCTDLPKTYKDEAAFAASNTNIKSIDN
ncbi:MAG TPA: oxidoreductase, partial [Saprospiraceae bacterium]|nr:oxidoreductase [Saprospiraceae bacterium]